MDKRNNFLYLCDGKACKGNCAENGHKFCYHTHNENHAKNKIKRQRKFELTDGIMMEVDK